MPSPYKEANVTDFALIIRITSEAVLLYIRNAFHEKSNGKKYYPSNVPSCTEGRLVECGHFWGIEYSNW